MAVAMGRLGALGQPSKSWTIPVADAAVDLGEEEGDAQPQVGDPVAVAVRGPFDQAMRRSRRRS